jgi:hypothetical protein
MTEQELREKIIERPPGQLVLDLENPRFGLSDAANEPEALRLLAQRANLKELWDSIAARGFESYEPLVGFETAAGSNRFVIVEGNRRLAAVKTLLNPELLTGIKSTTPPELGAVQRATLNLLPVYVVGDRHEADDYIGYKHINGPQTWGSLAKAKFAVRLFDKMPAATEGDNRVQILSRRLGDSRQLIIRTLVAYKIFEQARELEYLSNALLEEQSIDFSHLYTVLQSPAARSYIGLPEAPLNEKLVRRNPVPKTHGTQLRNLFSWLFGAEGTEPVIKQQGSDRPKLLKVLASPVATETLEQTRDFERAVAEAGFAVDDWFGSTVKLEALSKRVSDGVSDLPADTDRDVLGKGYTRITASGRNVAAASALLQSLFKIMTGAEPTATLRSAARKTPE